MVRWASRTLALLGLGACLWAGTVQAQAPAASSAPAQGTVQVQPGDMASVLAFRLKPRGATIEQMMVALLRSNPEAFALGNVNVLREGAVLRLPSPELVLGTPPEQAHDWVRQHHQAFLNGTPAPAFGPSPEAQPAAAEAAAAASSPAQASQTEPEDVRERLRQARARLAQLEQNIQELERLTALSEGPNAQPTPTPAPASAEPGLPASWLWLMVFAIVASMVGIGHGRVNRRSHHTPPTPTPKAAPADGAAQFQARLQTLDLDLGSSDTPHTGPAGRRP
jgi:pilus assembly protein FimV